MTVGELSGDEQKAFLARAQGGRSGRACPSSTSSRTRRRARARSSREACRRRRARHGVDVDPRLERRRELSPAGARGIARAVRRRAGVARVLSTSHPQLADAARRARAARLRARRQELGQRRSSSSRPSVTLPVELDRDTTRPRPARSPTPRRPARSSTSSSSSFVRTRGFERDVFVRAALGPHGRRGHARVPARAREIDDPTEALARVIAEKRSALRRSATPRAHRVRHHARGRRRARGAQGVAQDARARVRRRRRASSGSPSRAACSSAACRAAASRSSARPRRGSSGCRSCASTSPTSSRCPRPSRRSARRCASTRRSRPWCSGSTRSRRGSARATSDAGQARVFGAFLTWLQERRVARVRRRHGQRGRAPARPSSSRRGRFDEIFFVDLPSAKERQDILAAPARAPRPRPVGVSRSTRSARSSSTSRAPSSSRWSTSALFRAFAHKHDLTDADLRAAAREHVAARDALRGEDPGAPHVGQDARAPGVGRPAHAGALRGLTTTAAERLGTPG